MLRHHAFGIVRGGLAGGLLAQAVVARLGEQPVDAVGKVFRRAVGGHVAVVQVIYHLGYAAHVEAHAGRAAGHGFHDGVGQVVFQRGGGKEVDGVVDVYQLVVTRHKVQRIDLEGEQAAQLLGVAAEGHHGQTVAQLRVLVGQQAAGLHEVVYALALVGYLDGAEEHEPHVLGKLELAACRCLVVRAEEVGVDGVGDAGDGHALQQGALACLPFEPPAAGDEVYLPPGVEGLLAAEGGGGEVFVPPPAGQVGAVVAGRAVVVAAAGIVADAGAGPHVVHGPHHGFARVEYLADVFQREHALVHPVQVDDVCLLEFGQRGDVVARVGNVHGKEVLAAEAVGCPNDHAFPYKLPHHAPTGFQRHYGALAGLLVAHQHLGLDALRLEGFHQPVGGYGGSADAFGSVDEDYSHVFVIV